MTEKERLGLANSGLHPQLGFGLGTDPLEGGLETNRDQWAVNRISCEADAGRKKFPFVIIAGVGFPNGHSNPVRLAVVAIDPVDLNISEMSPDSIGQSVADQSFKFVGGHRRPFHGLPP